jgi:hypothetical protein
MDNLLTDPTNHGAAPIHFAEADLARLYERYTAKNDIRPWTSTGLTTRERAAHLDLIMSWVDFLNATYTWTESQIIPPCWPVHPTLERELTTLYWTYYEAFEAEWATAPAAQVWHDRYLTGFHARLTYWTTVECRQGNHKARPGAELLRRQHEPTVRNKTRTALTTALTDTLNRPHPPAPPEPPLPSTWPPGAE